MTPHTHHDWQDTAGRNILHHLHLLTAPRQRMWPLLTQRHMTSGSVLRPHSPAWSHWVCPDETSPTSPPWGRERERERQEKRERHGCMFSFTLLSHYREKTLSYPSTHSCMVNAWQSWVTVSECVYLYTLLAIDFPLFYLWHLWQREDLCSNTQSYNVHSLPDKK